LFSFRNAPFSLENTLFSQETPLFFEDPAAAALQELEGLIQAVQIENHGRKGPRGPLVSALIP
jgi:hypothetical protein